MATKLPTRLFVTGTDTGVGKSYVGALLTVGLEASYWKPVQSGADADADWVRRVTGLPAERVLPETYRLRAPLSPHEAARREGVQIEMSRFALPKQERLIVEGAGGVMVPLDDRHLMVDLMVALGLPVLVVARSELGTINHTLLTLDQLRRRGCPLLGVVVNGPPNPANCQAIAHYGEVPVLAEIDRRVDLAPAKVWALFDRYFGCHA
ncbi:MAG: dethiobiotin synthase [Gemmatimonadetes bacterium]|nr:dethiobiotin synthase [Gemmatimonadota bacterium]MYI60515.1 dethiobiotin synthase [Gemmatimonadota bacterium]